jgi:hypothetical protein
VRGYRYGEVPLPLPGELKTGTHIGRALRPPVLSVRPPALTSLGCHVEGVAMPHPDLTDTKTAQAGVAKRFACKTPEPNRAILRRLRRFVRKYIKRYVPLPADSDTSVETWLKTTRYPAHRKEELLRKYEAVEDKLDPKYFRVKSFVKDETYSEFKHARGINSRTDEFKCFVGPIFKLIEAEVYKDEHFIKHIPVRDRPAAIYSRLHRPGATYLASDYTAFESLFVREIMNCVEFELYKHMTKFLPDHKDFMWYCHNVLAGVNTCSYKNFTVKVKATRMSGEMCTSLGNGFSNLMFMLFAFEEMGCTGVDGFVEGDDGIFVCNGSPPTEKQFEDMGLRIKMVEHSDLARASFCGLIFDLEDQANVTNPLEVICSLGWTSNRYAKSNDSKLHALLRCKALSLAHQYPGCPIIQPLAFKILSLTQGLSVGKLIHESPAFSQWERDQLIDAFAYRDRLVEIPIGINTRCLVAEEFGISLAEQQYIETLVSEMSVIKPFDDAFLRAVCPNDWKKYFETYSFRATPDSDLQHCPDFYDQL